MTFTIKNKIKRPVNILINDGCKEEISHIIFLDTLPETEEAESIKDYLERNIDLFVPSLMYQTETTTVFRALKVSSICYIKDLYPIEKIIEIKKEISFVFSNGTKLNVAIDKESDKDQNRVIDYLNRPERFIELVSSRSSIFINKDLVSDVTEIE